MNLFFRTALPRPFVIFLLAFLALPVGAEETAHNALVRDIASIEGVRDNQVLGYGLVVGLKGTGDRQQTIFTIQTLANVLQRMGVQIPAATVVVKNVAAAFVTATLPPFATPGMRLDVTVSSAGDARSLEGGMLLLTPLYAADGQVYAAAHHPTVGRIPGGGLVERDSSVDLEKMNVLTILLSEPNFSTAEQVAAGINRELHNVTATVKDSRRIEVKRGPEQHDVPALLARIEDLSVEVRRRARVVINERTGTVVMGRDVRLGAVSILHGSFSIEVSTQLEVSQPQALSNGETKIVPETTLKAEAGPSRRIELNEGASVDQLVNGLQKIGATSRDVIAILQAIKAAGALDADLEVI
jgi:flagellar P-ring protein FlgI